MDFMNYIVPIMTMLIIVSAILHIRAEYLKRLRLIYIFKPLTTGFIILFGVLQTPAISPAYKYLIVLGLISSLCGDIFLMLPSDQFIAGLVSFLIAHVFYILAFTREFGFQFHLVFLMLAVLVGGIAFEAVLAHTGSLTAPVMLYTSVILVMLWQALERWHGSPTQSSILAFVGAACFVFSDFTLAYNRFVREFKAARFLILSTYYAAQWCLALSVKLLP